MEYREIPGFSRYGISESGEVIIFKTGKILKPNLTKFGRLRIGLRSDEGKSKKLHVHQIVAIAYLRHQPCGHERVVDHIDNDKLNNHVSNLQIISNRENVSKDKWRHNYSSQYKGVAWNKQKQKWRTRIAINGKGKHLGFFSSELDAARCYELALQYIDQYQDKKQFRQLIKQLLFQSRDITNTI
jgi:hypothetical protein